MSAIGPFNVVPPYNKIVLDPLSTFMCASILGPGVRGEGEMISSQVLEFRSNLHISSKYSSAEWYPPYINREFERGSYVSEDCLRRVGGVRVEGRLLIERDSAIKIVKARCKSDFRTMLIICH